MPSARSVAPFSIALLWALTWCTQAQPKSAIEFYDTTGQNAIARLGHDGQAFYLNSPADMRAFTATVDSLTVPGTVSARKFVGDGSELTGIASGPESLVVTSEHIADSTISDVDISPDTRIAGTKISPDFGGSTIKTTGAVLFGDLGAGRFGELSAFRIHPIGSWLRLGWVDTNGKSETTSILEYAVDSAHMSLHGRVTIDTLEALYTLAPPSDIRLKRDVEPLPGCLDKISKLEGKSFHWRRDVRPDLQLPEDKQIGFIAHEVESVVPEAVQTDNVGYKRVDYAKLVVVLTNAVNEQQALLQGQADEIERLSRDVARLRGSASRQRPAD